MTDIIPSTLANTMKPCHEATRAVRCIEIDGKVSLLKVHVEAFVTDKMGCSEQSGLSDIIRVDFCALDPRSLQERAMILNDQAVDDDPELWW